MEYPLNKTEEQWKQELEKKDTEFCVKGTEYPHTGGTIFIMKKAPIVVVVVGSLCLKVIRNLMLIADGHPLMMQFLAK
jgi:hypothetical protein